MLLLLSFLSTISFAAPNEIEVDFKKLNQTVIVKIEKSRCTVSGEKAFQLESVTPDKEAKLVCKLRPPVDQYDSAVPILLVEDFKFPDTILKDIEATEFKDLKAQGIKAIKTSKPNWGTEYTWKTPTMGTSVYSYLCPKKSKHCFRVIHGGIEFLSFRVRPGVHPIK